MVSDPVIPGMGAGIKRRGWQLRSMASFVVGLKLRVLVTGFLHPCLNDGVFFAQNIGFADVTHRRRPE